MRSLLAIAMLAVALAGCSSSEPADGVVKAGSGEVTNPGGKPQTAEEEAYAKKLQEAGSAVNDDRAKMAEARRRAGQ
ncbi:MAG: hypothetical protein ACAH95_00670 [Fimbriimonas sp.]